MSRLTFWLLICCVGIWMTACLAEPESADTQVLDMDVTPVATIVNLPPEQASVVRLGDLTPPEVVSPCLEACLFEGQVVTVLVNGLGENGPMSGPLYEIKEEFEAATGATLEIVEPPIDEHFTLLITDLTTGAGRYDASIAGAWWIGDLVSQGFIMSYDPYYGDPRFPEWNIDDVQSGPRSLLEYEGRKYMVANDHDGQIMYYRRDLLEDATHQAAFEAQYGYPLIVPETWDQFRDVAEYFDGQDLNGDGTPDDGLTMHLKEGQQGMFHFMSFSAPFVIGAQNPNLYWFDPETMEPLIDSPGHAEALESMVELVEFGPDEMLEWNLGQSWDHFLRGEAAITFTWGDLGALAQQEGSLVKGVIGSAQLPGTTSYYSIPDQAWIETEEVNYVGNTTGGSWAGVISRFSDAPEATYYLLALMATKDKSLIYAARGWDGIDPGRFSHYLPPNGTADLESYLAAGWDTTDVQQYSEAYFNNFNNQQQFPYLRIPGTFGYWSSLDIHLFEAVKGQVSPEQALAEAATDFEELTNLLGREQQIEVYRASLGISPDS